ncbi:MAG: LacI family DNA-binding transcriptional regulator [Pseudomonadota bacterium]
MPKRATIIDVARQAGVSKSTVSLVLRNSPLVKDSTRAQVEAAMSELGYVYNRAAAGLRGGSKGLIGLVINDLRNPFFTEFAASAQMAFARKGYATVIANTDEDPALQGRVIDTMIEHGVAAFVISPAYGGPDDHFEQIRRAGLPAMQVLRQVDERTELFPFASLDYSTGGALATRHLIETGCRRIGFFGGLEDRPITLERMSGYADVMKAEGMKPVCFQGRPSRSFGRDLALTLDGSIDGGVCFSDLVALGMLSGFAERGVRVGTDFRLVGFDDIEECSLSFPRLSSVRCNTAEFGEGAAESLLRWIDDGSAPPAVTRAPVELVVRESSAGPDMNTI